MSGNRVHMIILQQEVKPVDSRLALKFALAYAPSLLVLVWARAQVKFL